jgi:O-antigen/teichoic acid export membrane protein
LLCLYFLDAQLELFAAAWLSAMVLLLVFELLFSGMWRHAFWGRPDQRVLKQFSRYGIPLMMAGLCNTLLNSADRYFLAGFRGEIDVALYGVCFQCGMIPMLLIGRSVTMVVLPMAVNAFHNRDGLEQLLRQAIKYTMMMMFPLAAIGMGAGRWFLTHFTRPEYAQAAPVLSLVLIGVCFLTITHLYRVVFMVFERTSVIAHLAMLGAILSVVLNLLLIPLYGYIAAGIVFVVAQFLLLVCTARAARRVLPIPFPWKEFFLSLVAAACMWTASATIVATSTS